MTRIPPARRLGDVLDNACSKTVEELPQKHVAEPRDGYVMDMIYIYVILCFFMNLWMTSLSLARHLKFYRLYFFGVHTWLLLPSLAAAALNCPTIPLVTSGGVQYHGAGTTERIRSASKAMPAVVAPWPQSPAVIAPCYQLWGLWSWCVEVSETRDLRFGDGFLANSRI